MGMTKAEWTKWCDDNAAALALLGISSRQALILRLAYGNGPTGSALSMYDGVPTTFLDPALNDLMPRVPQLARWCDSMHSQFELTLEGTEFVNENRALFSTIR